MVVLNDRGYVCRRVGKKRGRIRGVGYTYRDWWSVRWMTDSSVGIPLQSNLCLNESLLGKRVRLRLEVLDDIVDEDEDDEVVEE